MDWAQSTSAIIVSALAVLLVAAAFSEYFYFRFFFGFWPKQQGAERNIAPRLNRVKAVYKVLDYGVKKAEDEYASVSESPKNIRASLEEMVAAIEARNALALKYFHMRNNAEYFGYMKEVQEAGRDLN